MTTDYVAAIDDMAATFDSRWKADSATVAGIVPKIFYPGVVESDADKNRVWGRFFYRTLISDQTSLRNGAKTRHTAQGLVGIQMFAPIALPGGLRILQQLSGIAQKALAARSLSGTVWFRSPRVDDTIPPEAAYYRLNVVAEFEYDALL